MAWNLAGRLPQGRRNNDAKRELEGTNDLEEYQAQASKCCSSLLLCAYGLCMKATSLRGIF